MNKIELATILKLFIFGLFVYLFFLILKPFIAGIIIAIAFAIVFYPFAKKLRDRGLGESSSAFLTVFLTLIFIIIPLALLVTMITREAIVFAQNTDLNALRQSLDSLTSWNVLGYQIDLEMLKEKLLLALTSLGAYASSKSLVILSTFSNSIFLFFVFLLLYYYFLRDAKTLLVSLQKILPYEKTQQKNLFKAFTEISKTIFYGNVFAALIAGLVAYAGFLIFGFKGALIWALLTAVFSFIPTIGTLLIYLAGILILFFTDGWLTALLMLTYFIIVELIIRETFIRGKILEDKLKFHPILVFFALVGGVTAFGSLGLIYGPLIVTFLGALYQFYAVEKGATK